jgi:hypothetical protein
MNIIAVRECMTKLPELLFNYKEQIKMINMLYFDNEFAHKKLLEREIDKKISSYKTQDINKNKYDGNNINREETVEKLVASKLKCYYCKSNVLLFYNKVRDMEQWTLDRIDNNINHSNNNVIIACLKCNLQRRCQDKDKFLFTKQLKIIKQ